MMFLNNYCKLYNVQNSLIEVEINFYLIFIVDFFERFFENVFMLDVDFLIEFIVYEMFQVGKERVGVECVFGGIYFSCGYFNRILEFFWFVE